MIKDKITNFIREDNFTDNKIKLFIKNNGINTEILINETFKDINRNTISRISINNNKYNILNGINLLITLCSYKAFNKNEVELYKLKIKQIREKLLFYLNNSEDSTLRLACNKLDEIVLGKSEINSKIIAIIKQAIDSKEDVDNIKKLIYLNKEDTILKQSSLFDYVFYKALESISNNDLYVNYYITLLKIFYNSNIKKENYLDELNKYKSNSYTNEIYNIIYGDKRSLSLGEILTKYDKNTEECSFYYPKQKYLLSCNSNIITIDNERCDYRDDAISVTKDGNNYIIGLYMADIGGNISYDSDLDIDARTIFENSYLSDRKIMILPKSISSSFSLNKRKEKNVMALYMIIDPDGNIIDYFLKKENICIRDNYTYSQADFTLNGNSNNNPIFDLYALSLYIKSHININKNSFDSKCRNMVSIYSILCNKLLSDICKDNNFPLIFTARTKVNSVPKFKEAGIELDDRSIELLNSLKTYEFYTTQPLLHYKLDIEGYAKVKSALRRYSDLYNQYLLHKYYFKDKDFDDSNIEKMTQYFNFKTFDKRLFEEEYNRKAQTLKIKRH